MQEQLAKTQDRLSKIEFEETSGGDKVVVKMNGTGEVLSLKIHPSIVSPSDVEGLEVMVLAAFKKAAAKAKDVAAEEMGKVTKGWEIPGLTGG